LLASCLLPPFAAPAATSGQKKRAPLRALLRVDARGYFFGAMTLFSSAAWPSFE
jgi:hypothetical protein